MKRAIFFVMMLAMIATAQDKDKKKTTTVPVPKEDSTTVWLKRTEALNFLKQRREQLKQSYIEQDAMLGGQLQLLESIAQDSVRVKK